MLPLALFVPLPLFLSLHLLVILLLLFLDEAVHDGGEHEVQRDEGADDDYGQEEERRRDVASRVLIVVHQVAPALQRDHLEDCDLRAKDVVEICNVVENLSAFPRLVDDPRVQAVGTVDVAAFGHDVGAEAVGPPAAHGVRVAQPGGVLVDGPHCRAHTVKEGLRLSAEVVLLSVEEINPKNRENREEEAQEDAHVEQAWDRAEQRLDELAHAFEGADGAQWAQDSRRPKALEELGVRGWRQARQGDADNQKVHHVPAVTQVRVLLQDKAHGNNLDQALAQEYVRKDDIRRFKHGVPRGHVRRVVVNAVLLTRQQDGVRDNAQRDEAVEPRVVRQVDEGLPERIVLRQAVKRPLRVQQALSTELVNGEETGLGVEALSPLLVSLDLGGGPERRRGALGDHRDLKRNAERGRRRSGRLKQRAALAFHMRLHLRNLARVKGLVGELLVPFRGAEAVEFGAALKRVLESHCVAKARRWVA